MTAVLDNSHVDRGIADLTTAVMAIRPLTLALGRPAQVAVGSSQPAAEVLSTIADMACVDLITYAASADADRSADGFDRLVSRHLAPALTDPAVTRMHSNDLPYVRRIARRALAVGIDQWRRADVVSFDGASLPTYAGGDPAAPAVVLASACGMPAQAVQPWMDTLAEHFFVMTWESRGLFGPAGSFDALRHDLPGQAADAIAVMNWFAVPTAHVIGFCGGCVIALHAAASWPDRISSLTLLHGAYELGADVPKLPYHSDIQALMSLAGADRHVAAIVHSVLLQTMFDGAPPDMAYLTLYPYANADLFYRYCRMNGAVTDFEVAPLLEHVRQPTLVVASRGDTTVGEQGSIEVARALRNARLDRTGVGPHLSIFTADGRLSAVVDGFLRTDTAAPFRLGDAERS